MQPIRAITFAILSLPMIEVGCRAESFTTSLNELSTDPSAKFVYANFDFGFSFNRIDKIRVSLTSTYGVSSPFCTGSYCSFSFLAVNLDAPGELSEFRVDTRDISAVRFPDLYGEFDSALPNIPSTAYVSPPNSHVDPLTNTLIHDPWPEFLVAGRGAVRLQGVSLLGCILNCDSVPGIIAGPPIGISELHVIVEGTASPEPCANVLLGVACIFPLVLRTRSIQMRRRH
jgi:hypothetical protein